MCPHVHVIVCARVRGCLCSSVLVPLAVHASVCVCVCVCISACLHIYMRVPLYSHVRLCLSLSLRFGQVGNFRVEPPGLFRGRGAHPKAGTLKVSRPYVSTHKQAPTGTQPHTLSLSH
jgi:hypothetical protein